MAAAFLSAGGAKKKALTGFLQSVEKVRLELGFF